MTRLLILITCVLMACATVAEAGGKSEFEAPEAPKVEAPKFAIDAAGLPAVTSGMTAEDGPLVVAMVPFGSTAGAGSETAVMAANEIALALQQSGRFHPMSQRDWMNANYRDQKAANIKEVLDRAAEVGLPIHYICTGNVFLSGSSLGLVVSLYPLDSTQQASHYFRYTSRYYNQRTSVNSLDTLAGEIVHEMTVRAFRPADTVVPDKIFVRNIGLNFVLLDQVSQMESELDFATFEGVQYNKADQFLAELLHYYLYATGVMETEVAGPKSYFSGEPTIDSTFVVDGRLKIIKNDLTDDRKTEMILTTTVTRADDPDFVIFTGEYDLDHLTLDSLCKSARLSASDTLLSLLEPELRNRVGQVDIPSFYGNEGIYLNEVYLGRGNQDDLLVPIGQSVVKTYHTGNSQRERIINVTPYSDNDDSADQLLVGIFYNQGVFATSPVLLYGGGFSFTMSKRNHEMIATISQSYGKFNDDQFSLATRIGVALVIPFLPEDSDFRLYGGMGVFGSFWTDVMDSEWASFFSLGLFPEMGLTMTIAPFRLRLGIGYDFDLMRYVTATHPEATAAGYNLSGLNARLSFSYFLK